MNYNYADQLQYSRELRGMVEKMSTETEKEVEIFFDTPTAERYFVADASISDIAKKMLDKLKSKFYKSFSRQAFEFSTKMVKKANRLIAKSLNSNLQNLNVISPNFIPAELNQVIKSTINENVSLIVGIAENYFKAITSAVMTSITTGGGVDSLIKNLKNDYGVSDRKAKNIAFDQTRKAYNAINKQRMEAVGYEEFEWLHSGGGMHPRKSHVAMNGNIYRFDNLPVINKEQVDRGYEAPVHGIPGQAINCFLGNTKISLTNGCRNLWRYFHTGEIAIIRLNGGEVIECTLNHPILTLNGWLPANEIKEGEYLIGSQFDDSGVIQEKETDLITTFDDLFNSGKIINTDSFFSSKFNFHGDIPEQNVDSIRFDDKLPLGNKIVSAEQLEQFIFAFSNAFRNNIIFGADSEIIQSSSTGDTGDTFSFIDAKFGISSFICMRTISKNDSVLFQNFRNYLSTNRISFGQRKDAFAFIVTIDNNSAIQIDIVSLSNNGQNVIESFFESGRNSSLTDFINFAKLSKAHAGVKLLHRVDKKLIRIFNGHVYTMETFNGWFTISNLGIISKNCGCTMIPVYRLPTGERI